jgi:E3 ubiquitin-protein ligase UBR3
VLDELLLFWKERLCLVDAPPLRTKTSCKSVAEELTDSIADMLLRFCTCSESLLSFVSQRIRECPDLLEALTRTERVLDKKVVKKLHELLLKLITEPGFKFEFAKSFIRYYPVTISEVIKGSSDSLLEEYRLIPTFSVQIFTVPPLTTRLVREHNLLGVLLESLTVLFLSCVGEDGRLQVCLASPFRCSRKLKCLCFAQLLCTDGIFLLFEHNCYFVKAVSTIRVKHISLLLLSMA